MSGSDNFIQPILYWLLMTCLFLDGILILARHFIKDEAVEKKRMFLFYCTLGATMFFMFFLAQIGLKSQDNASWGLVADLSGGGSIVLGFFIFYTYSDLWTQKLTGKNGGVSRGNRKN